MDFEYISTNIPGPGADPDDFEYDLAGCNCSGPCTAEDGQCSCLPYGQDNYDSTGRLLHSIDSSLPILECSSHCQCALSMATGECDNRCVQLGVTYKLEVFMTPGKGFGLRTLETIDKGRFVCEYAGEIIDAEEVERRSNLHKNGDDRHNYVLTLKEHFAAGPRIVYIDPTLKGNLARFINHSCDPNLSLAVIRIGQRIPHVGLFAARHIEPTEELTYHYGPLLPAAATVSGRSPARLCRCGAANCQKYLPTSPTATW